MSSRRLVIAAATYVVAVALAVIVPVAGLRTVVEYSDCCCPDPDRCKCDHDADRPTHTTMRACHKQPPDGVRISLPTFVAPLIASAPLPPRPVLVASHAVSEPHPAPQPRRPDAPS